MLAKFLFWLAVHLILNHSDVFIFPLGFGRKTVMPDSQSSGPRTVLMRRNIISDVFLGLRVVN